MILIVKSSFALPSGLALLLTLSACGQTGPLYMPHTPPKTARHHGNAATPATTPAPATAIGTATSPPAPAAGVVGPSVDSNANDTQATQPPTPPATQQ